MFVIHKRACSLAVMNLTLSDYPIKQGVVQIVFECKSAFHTHNQWRSQKYCLGEASEYISGQGCGGRSPPAADKLL